MDNRFKRQLKELNNILKYGTYFIVLGVLLVLTLHFDLLPKISFEQHLNHLTPDPLEIHYHVLEMDSNQNPMVKYGYELFQKTSKYIGPDSQEENSVYAGNTLSCGNCHLFAGTKPYSAPLIGVMARYPQYRGREDTIGTIEDRINGCMERSMNGRVLEKDSREMKAFMAYLSWLDRYMPKDGKVEGLGFLKIELPERPVDLVKGKDIFDNNCAICHQENGEGIKHKDSVGYLYPPLWGKDTYNNGAGMTRVITAAEFIKGNMPFGTTYTRPFLTDEECYDVAGYINNMDRPVKSSLEEDFPDLKKKPVSAPYPPFADPFSVEQHKYGPFQPIMEYYLKKYEMKKSK